MGELTGGLINAIKGHRGTPESSQPRDKKSGLPAKSEEIVLNPNEVIANPLIDRQRFLRQQLEQLDQFGANIGAFGRTGAYTLEEAFGTSDKDYVQQLLKAELNILDPFVEKINLAIKATSQPETKDASPKKLK